MTVTSCMRYIERTGDTRWREEGEGSVDGSNKMDGLQVYKMKCSGVGHTNCWFSQTLK